MKWQEENEFQGTFRSYKIGFRGLFEEVRVYSFLGCNPMRFWRLDLLHISVLEDEIPLEED